VDPFLIYDDGKMVDVGSLGGTSSFLTGLNNQGQMAGTMTLAGDVADHPFLWGGGVLTDLGTFGGDCGDANALNDAGEVIGWACDNQGAVFAFLWRNGVLINMGTVDGDPCSVADGINSRGQVVGESSPSCFGAPAQEAFLWENGGPAVDLNTLISPGSGLELAGGFSINDRGEINGDGVLPNGDQHAFLLVPCDDKHHGVEGCDYSLVDATAAADVNVTQGARTRSEEMQKGIRFGSQGRPPSRMARRYHVPAGMNRSEK
jgi:probable HAF family extracellular repeat protein